MSVSVIFKPTFGQIDSVMLISLNLVFQFSIYSILWIWSTYQLIVISPQLKDKFNFLLWKDFIQNIKSNKDLLNK